jgi:glutathione S-transferase
MALNFYALSGSPFSWKVWLALEHKQLSYVLHMLSADAGDLKTPIFLAINPRGKVPAIIDEGFTLYESSTIVQYLEDAYPDSGRPLVPRDAKRAAFARRVAAEADAYFYPLVRALVDELIVRREEDPDRAAIKNVMSNLRREFEMFEASLQGHFAAGDELSIADFAFYPLVALLARIEAKRPGYEVGEAVPAGVIEWTKKVESLPYFGKTTPPHWKAA